MFCSPKGKVRTAHTVEWLAAPVSVPVVRAIKHPAGLSFGATEVVWKVIGFLALQTQTTPSVCVWPRGMERYKTRKSWTMWCLFLIENKLIVSPQVETVLLPKLFFMAFSLVFQPNFFPLFVTSIRGVIRARSRALQSLLCVPSLAFS